MSLSHEIVILNFLMGECQHIQTLNSPGNAVRCSHMLVRSNNKVMEEVDVWIE
jgi:hypothetical protein